MKQCPCCNFGHPTRVCICSEAEITKYRARLSGALADRIDMHVTLAPVPSDLLEHARGGESSGTIRERVEQARDVQRRRYARLRTVQCNAHASGRWLLAHGEIDREARSMLGAAMESMNLSARGYHRVLRVARTISDLAGEKTVRQQHVAEALRFRPQ